MYRVPLPSHFSILGPWTLAPRLKTVVTKNRSYQGWCEVEHQIVQEPRGLGNHLPFPLCCLFRSEEEALSNHEERERSKCKVRQWFVRLWFPHYCRVRRCFVRFVCLQLSYWINGTIFFASAPLLSSWIGFRGSIYHLVIESICFVKRRTSSKTPPRLNDLLPFLDLCDKTN